MDTGVRVDTDSDQALLSGNFPSWRKDGVNRGRLGSPGLSHTPSIAFRHLPLNSARIGYATEGALFISTSDTPSIAFRHLPLNSARIGYATEGELFISTSDTPSIAFRHLPLNSARIGYATEGALFVPAQLSTNAVSAPRKAWVLIRLWKQHGVHAHM